MNTRCGPSDRVRTCGLMVPNHPRYQLRHTRISNILQAMPASLHFYIITAFLGFDKRCLPLYSRRSFCGAAMQKLCLKLPRRLYPKERMPFIRNTAKPHAVWLKLRRSGKSAAIARSGNAFILGGFAKPPAALLGSPCSPHGSQPAAKLRGGLALSARGMPCKKSPCAGLINRRPHSLRAAVAVLLSPVQDRVHILLGRGDRVQVEGLDQRFHDRL